MSLDPRPEVKTNAKGALAAARWNPAGMHIRWSPCKATLWQQLLLLPLLFQLLLFYRLLEQHNAMSLHRPLLLKRWTAQEAGARDISQRG